MKPQKTRRSANAEGPNDALCLVNSCYVSRGMGVRKVSNSKSDLQDHSRVLAMVQFDRPHTITYYCSIATMSPSCTVKEILSLIFYNLKELT